MAIGRTFSISSTNAIYGSDTAEAAAAEIVFFLLDGICWRTR